MNTILQITKVEPELLDEIKDSFDNLPETDHADGKYRLRKYSKIKVKIGMGYTPVALEGGKAAVFHRVSNLVGEVSTSEFTQSEDYNKHQGGMIRKFDNIDEKVLNSNAISEMSAAFFDACQIHHGEHEFDIHQMRVKCLGGATQIAPEGWHQDGYDHVAMIGVARNNIVGGEILLSTDKLDAPFLQATIDTGTMVIIDDSYLWHNGRSIQPVDDDQPAWMDVMVFTLKES